MPEWFEILLVLLAWFAIQTFVLPRLGVPT